jgi:putative membrane protein
VTDVRAAGAEFTGDMLTTLLPALELPLLEMHMNRGPMGGHHGYGFGFFGFLPGLLLLALVVVVVLLLVKGRVGPIRLDRSRNGSATASGSGWTSARVAEDQAFETLKMRLATGDITPEEFLERSSVLRSPSGTTSPPKADQ